MPRHPRAVRSREIAARLLLTALPLSALLPACIGGQTGSEGRRHVGPIVDCEHSTDAGAPALYDFTPQEVLDIAKGTWAGRYPGGDYAGPFDVTVTVSELEPADYVYTDDGVRYLQPRASEPDVEITEQDREGCVAMAVPAVVHVEASEPLFTLDRDLRHVWVFGTSLRSEPFEGGASDDKHPPGFVTTGLELNGPSVEIEYWFVFGSDGRLWTSIQRDGTLPEYLEAGRRL